MLQVAQQFALSVVSPKDSFQSFDRGIGDFETYPADKHLPVNFHAFAACVGGNFMNYKDISSGAMHGNVLLLIGSSMSETLDCIAKIRKLPEKRLIAVSFKETGLQQLSGYFRNRGSWKQFTKICSGADGMIATTPDSIPLYRAASPAGRLELIPTPYPIGDNWNIAVEPSARKGIFIGTREPFMPFRNHFLTVPAIVALGKELNEPVSVVCDGTAGLSGTRRLFAKTLGFGSRWHSQYSYSQLRVMRRQPPKEYLRTMASHKIVFQLDTGAVCGQVAGDALMCRIPCVGGTGTTERLVFPGATGHGRDARELLRIAEALLRDDLTRERIVESALDLAAENISFERVAAMLREFYSFTK